MKRKRRRRREKKTKLKKKKKNLGNNVVLFVVFLGSTLPTFFMDGLCDDPLLLLTRECVISATGTTIFFTA